MERLWAKVRKWYEGELRLWDQPPGDGGLFIGWSIDRHWTATVARVVVEIHKRDPWAALSFYVGTLIAIYAAAG